MVGTKKNLVLGLDLGTKSLGWVLIDKSKPRTQSRIVDMGVRIFDAGMDGDIESGNQESRNLKRREARLIRRQAQRRKRRKQKLMRLLQENDLLPAETDMAKAIYKIDAEALGKYKEKASSVKSLAHVVPYYLRSRALDHKLSKHELGRAIYQLAQRRGFLSNRKSQGDDESGVVKPAIDELAVAIDVSGARTLGEFFSRLDPEDVRIRTRYTSRAMYKEEFLAIMTAQKKWHGDILFDDFVAIIEKAIFYQRPLKSQKNLIGMCLYEKGKRRSPWYKLEAQRFRILQTVNNLRVQGDGDGERDLELQEHEDLLSELEVNESLSFAKIKKLLNLPARKSKFNLEEGGAKTIKGNVTNARLFAVFGDKWTSMSEDQKHDAIIDIVSFRKNDALRRKGKKYWKLKGDALDLWEQTFFEDDYCNLSINAINKLLPLLEEGYAYASAVKQIYGGISESITESGYLPMLDEALPDIKNPIVHRCLSEVRQVVNAIIRKYGKPNRIKVELARDIKQGKKEKQKRTKNMRDNEKARKDAKERLIHEFNIQNPSRDDVLKVLLAEECAWMCPYTGKTMGWNDLFGSAPCFDIEHIIPYSVSLDDSFVNKTLCYHTENRNVKRNMTPFQAYSGDEEKYQAILLRVRNFRGRLAKVKLKRFEMENLDEFKDFSSRHLNDTRYASRLATRYLAILYGGKVDEKGHQAIQSVSGGITAVVRRSMNLNSILGNGEKTRSDHRHHTIDALTVALTSARVIDAISRISEKYPYTRINFENKMEPWDGFLDDVRSRIDAINVSHHKSRKIRGPLHKETIYSDQGAGVVHIRTFLSSMKAKDVDKIVDPVVKAQVQGKLIELGEKDPSKAFAKEENFPRMPSANGPLIKKARIKRKQSTFNVGEDDAPRYVVGGNTHHMEIIAVLDEEGHEVKWKGRVVSMYHAYERKKLNIPVVDRTVEENEVFKMSISGGDILEMDSGEGRRLFVLRIVPESKQISYVSLNDARMKKDIIDAGDWFTKMPGTLRTVNARKVTITPLGEIRNAND